MLSFRARTIAPSSSILVVFLTVSTINHSVTVYFEHDILINNHTKEQIEACQSRFMKSYKLWQCRKDMTSKGDECYPLIYEDCKSKNYTLYDNLMYPAFVISVLTFLSGIFLIYACCCGINKDEMNEL